VRAGTSVSVTPGRFVLLPKNLVTGVPKARIVKLSDPVAGRTPLEGDYNLKPGSVGASFRSRKPMDTLSSAGFLRSGPAHRRSEGPYRSPAPMGHAALATLALGGFETRGS
jgi:hypothetical protein